MDDFEFLPLLFIVLHFFNLHSLFKKVLNLMHVLLVSHFALFFISFLSVLFVFLEFDNEIMAVLF